ncbi:Signal recognition particle 54 kDa protein 2 [Vitis vinifera]|uniref:Signal recognition particle 54 kDa protein 2 n=1 Tax=Vitis vinifera TaxID=29760 RepID=A0A438I5R5_VITVI|nr:Signal recognition particle 54 kDa protein 2 [Vitis vinifera]
MSRGLIGNLEVGRFLEWGDVDSRGVVGGFYGPTLKRGKEWFWGELGVIKGLWSGPWCVAGDFNLIKCPEERNKGRSLNSDMRRFFEVNAMQCVLPRPVYDHFPILLDGGGLRRGPSPFRFENMWVEAKKDLALDQVDYWDAEEKTSTLSLEELEARKEFETLETLDALALEVPFTEEEVFGALLGCSGDKALGPNGFSMTFWQFSWDFVKDDVMRFFKEFYEHEKGFWGEMGWVDQVVDFHCQFLSMLVNGTSTGFFQNSRGLRLRDPFLPYLFVIAMEGFSCLLKRAMDGASQDQLTYLSWLLIWFEAVSRLRINLEKSELIPVVRVENIDDLAMDFGCRVGSLLSTYLGLPLGASFKSVTIWDGVEERFRRRGKYGEERKGWCSWEVREAYGVGLWKGIRMDWDFVDSRISFLVGNRWREAWVTDIWDPLVEGGWGGWNPCFRRAFNDWEVEEAESFLEWLHGKRVRGDVEDMVFWTETKSTKFSVKALYYALDVAATKSPVIFIGTGEHMDEFEVFDVKPFEWVTGSGFMDKIHEVVPMDQQPELLQKLSEGNFTLRIMYEQFQNILKMGPIGQVFSMLPGFSAELMPKGREKESQAKIKRYMTMMDSMTNEELDTSNPKLMNESRIMRIARGSGRQVREVMEMLEEYKRLAKIWSKMKGLKIPKKGEMSALSRNMNAQHMSKIIPQQMLKQIGGMGALQNLMKQVGNNKDMLGMFGGGDK